MPRDESDDQLDWRLVFLSLTLVFLAWMAAQGVKTRDVGVARDRFGYTPDADGTRAFLRELEQPLFAQAGAEVIAKARGVDTFLYRYADRAHRAVYGTPFTAWKQGIGDCVSFGFGGAAFVAQSVDWATGKIPNPPLLICTEAIYGGSRVCARNLPGDGRHGAVGGWSDGSYGAAAAKWITGMPNGTGGILYRQKYLDGKVDLTTYDPQRAKAWGAFGCGGENDDGRLDKIANEHRAQNVALVKTFDEAAAAIESGFPVAVCCQIGFSNTRDKDGFAAPSARWSHCQFFCATRYAKNAAQSGGAARDGLLCMNSWGTNWQAPSPRWPSDMPDGSYWVDRKTVDQMLSGLDSFAVGGADGFKFRRLTHDEWAQPSPDEGTK
jgi:hypothetical protein